MAPGQRFHVALLKAPCTTRYAQLTCGGRRSTSCDSHCCTYILCVRLYTSVCALACSAHKLVACAPASQLSPPQTRRHEATRHKLTALSFNTLICKCRRPHRRFCVPLRRSAFARIQAIRLVFFFDLVNHLCTSPFDRAQDVQRTAISRNKCTIECCSDPFYMCFYHMQTTIRPDTVVHISHGSCYHRAATSTPSMCLNLPRVTSTIKLKECKKSW